MTDSKVNLEIFTEFVRNVPVNAEAEEFVRMMLAKFAKSCPVNVLVKLGECIIECRKAELRAEAERN